MPLHSAFENALPMRWAWYAAFNSRRGRLHLMQVPYLPLQREQIVLPPHLDAQHGATGPYLAERQERYITSLATQPRIPSGFYADTGLKRYCNRAQQAEYWTADLPPSWQRRGVCKECFDYWTTIRHEVKHGPFRTEGAITGNITPSNWYRQRLELYTQPR